MRAPLRLAPLTAVLLAALVAAACSGSTKTAPLGEWVEGLCRAADAFQSASDAAGERFAGSDLSDASAAKAAFADAVEEQEKARSDFRKAFGDLGRPDIDGGKEVIAAFEEQFEENDRRADELARRVADIPESGDFLSEFLTIIEGTETPEFRPRLEVVARDHPEVNDLIAAIDADPDCARVIFQADAAAADAGKEAWVSGVCTALGAWVDALTGGAQRLESDVDAAATPEDVRRTLIDFFEQALTDTRTLQRDIGRLSPPPVADGEAIHLVFVTASDDLVAALERLAREARTVDFSSLSTAQAESDRLSQLIDQLFGDVAASFDELDRYDPEGLDEFFRTLPECQF